MTVSLTSILLGTVIILYFHSTFKHTSAWISLLYNYLNVLLPHLELIHLWLCYDFGLLEMCINSSFSAGILSGNVWKTLSRYTPLSAFIRKSRSSIIFHNFSASVLEIYIPTFSLLLYHSSSLTWWVTVLFRPTASTCVLDPQFLPFSLCLFSMGHL